MIALDTNILIPLFVNSDPRHEEMLSWLANQQEALAITHTNIGEVLRLLTHPRIFKKPLSLKKAIELVQSFIEVRKVAVLQESESWWIELKDLLEDLPGVRGNEVFDARIALCLQYNGVRKFYTFDVDFRKYEFLELVSF